MRDYLDTLLDEDQPKLLTWRESKRGNPWRKLGNKTLTVFYRKDLWHWCCASKGEVVYSEGGYPDMEDAKEAVMHFARTGERL